MKRPVAFLLTAVATATIYFSTGSSNTTPAQELSTAPRREAVDVNAIIRGFAQKEIESRRALNGYAFTRDAVIQDIGMGGQIQGEYRRVSRFLCDGSGNRIEKITFFPVPTAGLTATDLEDLSTIHPFVIEPSKINSYNFTYAGNERVDEIETYVFDVVPKAMPDPKKSRERFFQGRIWLDKVDLQIVKARGKGVPEGKERYPTFETYREQVDGRHWFPTYTYADDQLVFPNGSVGRVRMRVRYTDFEKLKTPVADLDQPPMPVTAPAPSAMKRMP